MLPSFQSPRLVVRPRRRVDLDACLSMDRDPQVTQYIPGPWSQPDAHRAFVLGNMERDYPKGLGYWSVLKRDDSERNDSPAFIGWILLLPYGAVSNEVEIGWRFIRQTWGQGYATEAASLVLDYAFRDLKLDRIVADINPNNIASIRVAEKLGMKFVEDRFFENILAKSFQIRAKNYL